RQQATAERCDRAARRSARASPRRADGIARRGSAAPTLGDGEGRNGSLLDPEPRGDRPLRVACRRSAARTRCVRRSRRRLRTRARRGGLCVRRVLLVLRKDLLVLSRSPLLLALLIVYPLIVAGLVGAVAGYGSSKPRVALVDEDHLPAVVRIGGRQFRIADAIDEVGKNVHLVRMSSDEASRQLRAGRIVATLTVPPGFLAELESGLTSPSLIYQTTHGGISSRVTQQLQALVYELNRRLQEAFVKTDLHYVRLIQHGGTATFAGRKYDVLGLDRMHGLLLQLPKSAQRDRVAEFARIAGIALGQTGNLLAATASPIGLQRAPEKSRSSLLSAQVQAYALALTITFLALLLAAAALAAERDENAIGRLARGLVSLGELVWAKVALAAVVALALGLAIAV